MDAPIITSHHCEIWQFEMKKFWLLCVAFALSMPCMVGCTDSGENTVADADQAALDADKAYEDEMKNFGADDYK